MRTALASILITAALAKECNTELCDESEVKAWVAEEPEKRHIC
jgi:hypothetical protein